jgi:hypothetical protein
MKLARFALAAPFLLWMGCGQGVANIRAVGDGNEVLLVRAAADFNGDRTRWQVDVFRDGVELDDVQAQVQVAEGEDGALQTLAFQGNRFEIDLDGYAQTFRLVVNSGEDNVDAVFEGPSPVLITSPAAGTIFDLSQNEDLLVTWEGANGDEATEVFVALNGFLTTLVGDPGEVVVPFVNVDPNADQVTVIRSNIAILGGGAPGSILSISESAEVDFSVNQ